MRKNYLLIMKKIIFLFVAGLFIISSCKYDEGPLISFRTYEKRISGNWEIEYSAFNGQEVTLPINKSIDIKYNYEFTNQSPIVSLGSGIWSFNKSFTKIEFYNNSTLDSLYAVYDILKLRNRKLWIRNSTNEYRLIAPEK